MLCRKSTSCKSAFKESVFKLFINAVGGDLDEFTDLVYQRYVVEDFAYGDDMYYFGIQQYFQEKVVPHKIEVYKAGFMLARKPWFEDLKVNVEEFTDNLWLHDISKFSANEAFGYAMYDFKDPKPSQKLGFELAWHHHKMHNEHHPEYWMNPNRSGLIEIQPMPMIYILEMIADWIGAGMTYGSSLEAWLPNNLFKFRFHKDTVANIAWILNRIDLPYVVLEGFEEGQLTANVNAKPVQP